MRWISASFITLCLSACGGPTAPQAEDMTRSATPPAENVRYLAPPPKPIKTVKTPWGPRELYDPRKDPKFVETVANIYARGDVTFGDLKIHHTIHLKPKLPPDVAFVRNALMTQRLDMARAGCKTSYHYSYRSNPEEIGFARPCDDTEFGTPELSSCEQKNWRAYYNIAENIVLKIKDTDLPKYRLSDARQIDPQGRQGGVTTAMSDFWYKNRNPKEIIPDIAYIGTLSGDTLEDTIDLLTVSECDEWHIDRWPDL